MSFIARQSIESIKASINIYDVVSPVVRLKRVGSNYVGLSPFSHEKSPSFFVLPDKNIFKCFSSGIAGDAFRFIQETEKLNFAESVEVLAERFQLPIEYESGSRQDTVTRSLKRSLLDIHEYATDFYHSYLFSDKPEAASTLEYWLNQRKFTAETAREFRIGLAPSSGNALNEWLLKKGFSTEAMLECGLFYPPRSQSVEPQLLRQRFRGRLMIPIRDTQGQVIAFTARQLTITPADDPSREAKYVNSPETQLFHKSHLLFNLNRAREAVKDGTPFIMVEGQLDAIRCTINGFKSAIAPQGTSVTSEQLRLLKRYSDHLHVVLDGDSAGAKAALRVLPMALANGLEVDFVSLPTGSDPDSILSAEDGVQIMQGLLRDNKSAMEYACAALLPEVDPSPQQKAEATREIFNMLVNCESEVARADYLHQAIFHLRADPVAVKNDFHRFLSLRQKPATRAEPQIIAVTPLINKQLTTPEYEVLLLILQNDRLAEPLSEIIQHEWIDSNTIEGRLLGRIFAAIQEETWEGFNKMDWLLETDEERDYYYSAYAEEKSFSEPARLANAIIARLCQRFLKKEIARLNDALAQPSLKPDQMDELMKKSSTLNRLRIKNVLPTITHDPATGDFSVVPA